MPRVQISCKRCGQPFTIWPANIRPKGNFCSLPCARMGQWPAMLDRMEQKYIPEPNSGCWLWLGPTYGQTPRAYISKPGGKGKMLIAARVFWEHYRGEIPPKMLVCHTCDNALCVNPAHLYVGTTKDNMSDAVARGQWRGGRQQGTAHGKAKFTDNDVLEIRSSTEPTKSLAARFGVERSTIQRLRARKAWRHIP